MIYNHSDVANESHENTPRTEFKIVKKILPNRLRDSNNIDEYIVSDSSILNIKQANSKSLHTTE